MKNLSNKFLIPMPHINDPIFKKSLIYICSHDKDGAMGLIVNKPIADLKLKNEADSILKEKIKNSDKVSSDLTFLFGKNSFFINKYKQSINWLNKYLELRGQAGKYSDETIKFLELSNTKLLIETEKDIENVYVQLFSYNYINCTNDRKICPICGGSSVMIIENEVSKVYKTCPFSDNKGFLTCDEYNLFLRGELKPKSN